MSNRGPTRSNNSRGLKENEHFNTGNRRVLVNAPKGYPGKKYIKDKEAPGGRYAYRYAVDLWKKTGKVVNPSKEVVHHLDEAHDTKDYKFTSKSDQDVVAEPRKVHYKTMHGAPFSKRRATGRR